MFHIIFFLFLQQGFFTNMSNSVSEEKFNGSCQCGSIKVVLTGRPIKAMSCHCVDCQKSASGPYQTCALYPTSAVELIDPESNIKKYIVPKEQVGSGVEKEKWFCGVCGAPIYNRPMKHNGEKTVIKTGILER